MNTNGPPFPVDPQAPAAPTPELAQLEVDQRTQTVTIRQRQPLAITPDVVRVPWSVVKVLAANIMLLEAGARPSNAGRAS